jgi:hypothetical protein
LRELLHRAVTAVAVHDEDATEPAVRHAVEDVAHDVEMCLNTQRDRPGKLAKVRRDAVRDHGKHGDAEWVRDFGGETLRQNAIDGKPQVAVLLRAAERKNRAVVAPQVFLDLHPVHVADTHSCSAPGNESGDKLRASSGMCDQGKNRCR